ncbi:MAG: hypothetical protein CMP10_07055 [Zetaproteobacteria bacterium]|nr:hypothetical protein [Pseudobdellovibrionaceae bacterium]
MRKMRYLSSKTMSLGLSIYLLSACGPSESVTSSPKIDINIPQEELKTAEIEQTLSSLRDLSVDGTNTVPVKDLRDILLLPPEIIPYTETIMASRNETYEVTCNSYICKAVSFGSKLSLVIDAIKIPVIGTLAVELDEKIMVYYSISKDGKIAEVCDVKGVKVKKGPIKIPLDGGYVDISGEPAALVDAGRGGTYPNNQCK